MRRQVTSSHVECYTFLLHAADPIPGRIGELQVEQALVRGQREEVPPRRPARAFYQF
jgi:hypothetical protein